MKLNHDQRQQIKGILNVLLRRKFFIYICAFFAVVLGLGYYLQAPKIYRSSSLIMYQQRINPSEMSPDLLRFTEIISNVSQQITSRTSLENLIKQFGLYPNERARLPMEDVIDKMRKKITIKPSRNSDIFEVSFQGPSPRTVLLVTNALAAKFIEENIRLREETVSETSMYIKDELNMAKQKINKIETAMREYRLKYYNEMPERLSTNISRLNALQTQYQNYQNNMQDFERTKVLIQEQISIRKEILSQIGGSIERVSTPEQLKNLRLQLENLQTRYTDKHPDVKKLKSLIASLEQDLTEKNAEADPETDGNDIEVRDAQIFQMQQQLDTIEYNMERLNSEKEETRKQIELHKKWIAATPYREAEWSDLTRDYSQLSSHYQNLVAKNIQAESAESLERRQKGSQFKIIDPASFPQNPFYPNFIYIMLMALGIGLGTGVALSLFLEFLDTSFRDAHDLENFLNLPVACSVPVIRTKNEKMKKRLKSIIWFFTFVISLTILGGSIAFLWYKNIIIV
jgi:polysaccharide chain length determinant protein (PEP-CTERM system associated)